MIIFLSSSVASVSKIAIKTGNQNNAETDCKVVMKICDSKNKCCDTAPSGLDNAGDDRENGQTNQYTDPAQLNTCTQVG